MQSILITCKLTAQEDFHIGTGIGNIGLYDDGQLKDKDGKSRINASTMKGLLRDSCDQLNRINKLLDKQDSGAYFTQLFEHFDNLSSMDIQIAPVGTIPNPTVIHYFTAVQHDKRKAKDNTLRSVEFGSKNQEFDISIRYLSRNGSAKELADYIVMGLKNIKAVGGHRRRGFGAIVISDIQTDVQTIVEGKPVKAVAKKLDMILELAEDTILSSKAQSGNLLSSNDYLPGTTVLGMLRSLLLGNKSQAEYLDDGRVSSSFFYPLPAGSAHDFKTKLCPVFYSFRKKKQYQNPHPTDGGIPPWALKSNNSNKFIEILNQNTLRIHEEHADPGKGMYDGYLATDISDANWDNAVYYKVTRLYHQRNHIDPIKQSTKEGGVFIEEKIPQGTIFLGSVSFATEADCEAFIRDFDAWLSDKQALHVGRGGKPIIIKNWQFCPSKQSTTSAKIIDEFTISLLSDAILYDSTLDSLRTIDADVLKQTLGEPWLTADIKLAASTSRNGVISSFSGTSGLRKFRDVAIRKGSCFRFTAESCDMEALQKRLTELEIQGIGFRKNEGFGIIAINHPLHQLEPLKTEVAIKTSAICDATISPDEKTRLATKAAQYSRADELKKLLIKHTKDKWRSVVADLIVKLEAGVDYALIQKSLEDKMEHEAMDSGKDAANNSNAVTRGLWGKADSRYLIASLIIERMKANETPAVMANALKLTLNSKGGIK